MEENKNSKAAKLAQILIDNSGTIVTYTLCSSVFMYSLGYLIRAIKR